MLMSELILYDKMVRGCDEEKLDQENTLFLGYIVFLFVLLKKILTA